MAYVVEATFETAIAGFEQNLVEDLTLEGARDAIENFRKVIRFFEVNSAATGYGALAQRTTWDTTDDLRSADGV
jgi:hypothetical protein